VVARALRKLVEDETLYRAGYGIYVPSRTLIGERYAGYKIQRFDNSSVAEDFLVKMGVDPKPGLTAFVICPGANALIRMSLQFCLLFPACQQQMGSVCCLA